MPPNVCYLGFDFGTSGARAQVIDKTEALVAQAHCAYDIDDAFSWLRALVWLCASLPSEIRQRIVALSIAGTSATVVMTDESNTPLAPPLRYNDARAAPALEAIARFAPTESVVRQATASLAKLCFLRDTVGSERAHFCSDQSNWLAAMLTGRPGISDYHNALKLGYDVERLRWPDWMVPLKVQAFLPEVVVPGTALGKLTPAVAQKLGLPLHCVVRAGTTDSIAAFIASGAREAGDGVTSLGSTLVLKLLSTRRVEAARYGVYSHRYGEAWLAGGASNSGGAVLARFFDAARLAQLSQAIDPSVASPLDYYPLPGVGERFPHYDPTFAPRLRPRPQSDAAFLAGLLESMARIETQGYARLAELGATPVAQVVSAGGGAHNPTWQAIRARVLGIPVSTAQHSEAAYGAARLAKQGSDLLCLSHG